MAKAGNCEGQQGENTDKHQGQPGRAFGVGWGVEQDRAQRQQHESGSGGIDRFPADT